MAITFVGTYFIVCVYIYVLCTYYIILGFKVHTRVPVVISNGLRAAAARRYAKSNLPPQPPSAACSFHAYSYIQQSGRRVKTVSAKNMKNSPIHENADANITRDFGDGDISRYRGRFPHTCSLARSLMGVSVAYVTNHVLLCVMPPHLFA